MKTTHGIRLLCQAFEVSSSGYYDWVNRHLKPGPRACQNARLLQQIVQLHAESRKTYGSPRIQVALAKAGCSHGRNRIARLMRQEGLCGRTKRRFRIVTTDSNHKDPIAPNRLAGLSVPKAPNQIWVADITYIPTAEGWLYLAGIMDLCSRRIVGWAMHQNIDAQLVLSAWNMALTQRQPPPELILHSDRGSQYASSDFREALAATKTLASMSRKACCYDNAAMESFWSTLKLELIYRSEFQTHDQARRAIFDFVETFYNRRRLHSSLNYLSPVDFENQNN
jgi:transposase InsO family protein